MPKAGEPESWVAAGKTSSSRESIVRSSGKLGKLKKAKAIRECHGKEQCWMKDQDHKISREIVDFAKDNDVSLIRLG